MKDIILKDLKEEEFSILSDIIVNSKNVYRIGFDDLLGFTNRSLYQ